MIPFQTSTGDVLPHYLSQGGGPVNGYWGNTRMPGIMIGRVVDVYPTNHKLNKSKKFLEYSVAVEKRANNGILSTVVIPNCSVMNLYGGRADFEVWTPRKAVLSTADGADRAVLDNGSQVLVACINDSSAYGVIIGGVSHSQSTETEADAGVSWRRRFNGCDMSINKDGEFTLEFTGSTDDAGKVTADTANSNSKLVMSKDGSIKLQTKEGNQFFHLNHEKKTINMQSDGDTIHETKTAGYTVNAPAGLIHLNAIKGTKLGAGTDKMLMGSTYRTAEITKNTARIAGFTALAAQIATTGVALGVAGGSLAATATLHSIPVAGPVLGAPTFVAAAAAIIAASVALSSLAATITTTLVTPLSVFEGQAPTYLSAKNTLDF
jgi:hypothetical protein